jgi:hypothetical protein
MKKGKYFIDNHSNIGFSRILEVLGIFSVSFFLVVTVSKDRGESITQQALGQPFLLASLPFS